MFLFLSIRFSSTQTAFFGSSVRYARRTTNALDRIDSLTALSPTLNREAFRPTIRYEPIASELSFRKQWAHVLHQIEAMAAPTKI